MRTLYRLLLLAVILQTPIAAIAQSLTPPAPVGTPVQGAGGPAEVSAPSATPPAGKFVTVKDGSATVSGGSIIGEVIMWAVLLLGAPLAGIIAAVAIKFLKKLGVDVSDTDRARLKEFVENGLALAAQRAQADLKDKLPMQVRSKVSVDALIYVQEHGADTLKRLGVDTSDPKAVEALQARIAKAIDDKVPMPTATVVIPAPATPA